MASRVPLWLGSDNACGAERKDGASSWTALITGEVSFGVWPPVEKHKCLIMRFTKYNDKQVSSVPFQKRS